MLKKLRSYLQKRQLQDLEVLVFFDSQEEEDRKENDGLLTIYFLKADFTADQAILDSLSVASVWNRETYVVTDDRELRIQVRKKGGQVVYNDDFYHAIRRFRPFPWK